MNNEQIRNIIKNISEHTQESQETSNFDIDKIYFDTLKSIYENSFCFDKLETIHLNQNGKLRIVKQYKDKFSVEHILTIYIKKVLDRIFKVVYPNRNKIIKSLINTISCIIQMENFTIVRFDFKNYFNTISSEYVFEKYIKNNISNRKDLYLIKNFVSTTKFAYAGICTSNAIAEIISKYFDRAIYKRLLQYGLIFYERYIDDGIIILNSHIEKNKLERLITETISEIYYDKSIICQKCKVKLNLKKFKYISKQQLSNDNNTSVSFLGYEFYLYYNKNKNIEIMYGITEEKRKKYERKIDKLISLYIHSDTQSLQEKSQELELLRHRIAAFSTRQVYVTQRKNKIIWHVKGFISNYGELRFFIENKLIEEQTEKFLQNMILDAFHRVNLNPYFLKGNSSYNLYTNMKLNKTYLFVQYIGYSYKSLIKLCKKIGINEFTSKNKSKTYNSLVKEYLIKVKVGY